MLSAKVVCAIQILRELAVRKNQPESSGLKTSELKQQGTFQEMQYSKILTRLRAKGYIDKFGDRYILLTNLDQITLEDMVNLYHGGIVIGETYTTQADKLYQYDDKYKGLVQTERSLSDYLKKKLSEIDLSQLLFQVEGAANF